ncbi:SDR family oxidoreductase [Nocardia vinacea]|uniref:SDR family oxidoreductase n=1 Tax=Nocardia vinacea TaxID=96468 RepID=UPI002E13A321|nr:SDR family oxidoreductase [Nocardia vinacea]
MTIAITGTASGIGAATAAALGAAGHKIIGVDLRDADITADLSDSDARGAVIDEVLERSGGVLDGLVLSAGLGFNFPDPMKVIEVNYRASLALLDGLLPALRKGESPAAVVVSSLASTQISWSENPIAHGAEVEAIAQAGDNGGLLAYAASKNAVTVGVRQRAAEWGAAGVRLNTVAPGMVDTPLFQAGLAHPHYGEIVRNFTTPIGRTGTPAEIASLITYLLTPQAGFIHGAQFIIDGGADAETRPTVV